MEPSFPRRQNLKSGKHNRGTRPDYSSPSHQTFHEARSSKEARAHADQMGGRVLTSGWTGAAAARSPEPRHPRRRREAHSSSCCCCYRRRGGRRARRGAGDLGPMRAGRRLLELRRRTGVEWMDLAFLSGRSPLCSGAGAALGSCRWWWWCGFDLLFAPALLLFPPAIIIISPLPRRCNLGEGRGIFQKGSVCVLSSPVHCGGFTRG